MAHAEAFVGVWCILFILIIIELKRWSRQRTSKYKFFFISLFRILVLTLWSSIATSWWKPRFEKTKVAEPSLLLCRVSSHRIILLSFRYVWEYRVRDRANEEKRKHSKRWEQIRFLVARMCRQEVLPEILKMNWKEHSDPNTACYCKIVEFIFILMG